MQENMIKVANLEKQPALMYKLDIERSDSRYNLSARVLMRASGKLDPPAFYRRQNYRHSAITVYPCHVCSYCAIACPPATLGKHSKSFIVR